MFILGGVYDVIAFSTGHSDATLSRVIRDGCRDEPAISFFLGFALGHILAGMQ